MSPNPRARLSAASQGWMVDAECAGSADLVWVTHPKKSAEAEKRAAKAVCDQCPVLVQCLSWHESETDFDRKQVEQADALEFVRALLDAPIARIALENPVSVISSRIRRPDQIVQPWMFGHGETKATCLWLKNLPPLEPTDVVDGREQRVHLMPPSPDRWKERSRTYLGIAEAMAEQWGRVDGVQGVLW